MFSHRGSAMTEKTAKGHSGIVRIPPDPKSVGVIVDESLKPGSSVSFGFFDGTVSVTLDHFGDWTILVGLSARSDRIVSSMFSLERLGFFKATESEGRVYFLWTSALENDGDARSLVEVTLLEVLKALQRSAVTHYIC